MPLRPPKIVKSIARGIGDIAESAVDTGVSAAGTAASAGVDALRTLGEAEHQFVQQPVKSTLNALSAMDRTKDLEFPNPSWIDPRHALDRNRPEGPTFRDVGNALAAPQERVPYVGPVTAAATRALVDPLTIGGAAIKGPGLGASLIGRGTSTTAKYFAAVIGGAAAGATAEELGAPQGVVLAASLLGGGVAGSDFRSTRKPRDIFVSVRKEPSWELLKQKAAQTFGRVDTMLPWGQLDDDITDPAVRQLLGLDPTPDAVDLDRIAERVRDLEPGYQGGIGFGDLMITRLDDGLYVVENEAGKAITSAHKADEILQTLETYAYQHPERFGETTKSALDIAKNPEDYKTSALYTGAEFEEMFPLGEGHNINGHGSGEGFSGAIYVEHRDDGWFIDNGTDYALVDTAEEAAQKFADLGGSRAGFRNVDASVADSTAHYSSMSDEQLQQRYAEANRRLYERMSAMDETVAGGTDTRTDFNASPRQESLNDLLNMEVGEAVNLRDGYHTRVYRDDKDLWTVSSSNNRKLEGMDFNSAGGVVAEAFPERYALANEPEQAAKLVKEALNEVRMVEEIMAQKGLIARPGGGTSPLDQVYRNLRIAENGLPGTGALNMLDEQQKALAAQAIRSDLLMHDNLQSSRIRLLGFDAASESELKVYMRQLRGLARRYTPEYTAILDEVDAKIAAGKGWSDITRGAEFVLYAIHDALREATGYTVGDHDMPLLSIIGGSGGGGGGRPLLFGGFSNPFKRRGSLAGAQPIAPSYVAPMRELGEIIPEITVGGDPLTKMAIGHTSINRNVLIDPNNPVERIMAAADRLSTEAELLTGVAVGGSMGPVSRKRVAGVFSRDVLNTDADGFMHVSSKKTPGVKGKVPVNEIAEHPQDFNLTPDQEAFFKRAQRVIEDTFDMLAAKGMAPQTRDMGDRLYFPRQVSEIRGLSLDRASNAWMSRVYETFIDAYAAGVNVTDPVTALGLHVRAAYNHVINQELNEALSAFAVKPSALIPTPISKNAAAKALDYGNAMKATRVAEAAVHDEHLIQTATGNLDAQKLHDLNDILIKARQAQKFARNEHLMASGERARALQEARKATHAKGWLFGGADEDIKIKLWHEKLYRAEYVDAIEKGLAKYAIPEGWVGGVYKALNFQRETATGFDFAAPFTHGFSVLGQNPVEWAKASARHYAAFLDPTMVQRDIAKNLRWYQWMARHELAPTFTEIYQLHEAGGGFNLSKLDEVKVGQVTGKGMRRFLSQAGKQTYGRTGAAMELALMGYRRALVESLWDTWTGTESQLAEHVRLLTGAVNTRSLGLSGGRRVLESVFLGLSPRLLRSTLGLIGELRYGLRDPRGYNAAKSLATMIGAVGGLYYTIGKIAGKDDDELLTGLNPLSGKKFLSYRIGDEWYGVGGQMRATIQMLAGTYAAAMPEFHLNVPGVGDIGAGTERSVTDLWKLNPDNPVLQFWLSRSAPGVALGSAVLEAAGGGNPVPFENIDNVADLAEHLGRNTLPFALGGAIAARSWERDTTLGTVLNFGGLRVSKATPSELRNDFLNGEALPMLQEQGIVPRDVTSIEALGPGEYDAARRYLRDTRPDLLEQWEAFRRDRNSVYQRIQDERDAIDASYTKSYDALYEELISGTRDPREVLASLKSVRDQQFGETKKLYSDPQYQNAVKELMPSDLRKRVDDWFQITNKIAGPKGYLTDEDWEKVEVEHEKFLAGLDSATRSRFTRDLELRDSVVDAHPIMKVKRAVDAMSADYYDIPQEDAAGRTAYLKGHPEVDVARWFVYGGKLSSVDAVDAALAKRSSGPIGEALQKSSRPVLYANFKRPINEAPELWDASKAAIDWYFNSVVPSGKSTSVLTRRSDLNGVLAFWGYDVKLHSNAAKTSMSKLVENYTDWGTDGQWAKYGQTIMWWMNLTDAELKGDPKKNKRGAIDRRPDADAAYAWYRKEMFGVPPVLYSEAAKYYYGLFSGEDAEKIPVRSR